MMRVQPPGEPPKFNDDVRVPGRRFLQREPSPRSWRGRAYWCNALDDLANAFAGVCAYSSVRISRAVGHGTVDHFLPKSERPNLAYEWSNYRYASSLMNARKWKHLDVIDPCAIPAGCFQLDLPSLQVVASPSASDMLRSRVEETIERLHLNHEMMIQQRLEFVVDYRDGHIDLWCLQRDAPFLAYELDRQQALNQMQRLFPPP